MLRQLVCALLVFVVCAAGAAADEIVFKNGDRVTGKIGEVAGGKMKIKTAVLGDIEVKLDDVQTFTTDEPIKIELQDGTVLNQPARPSDLPGQVEVAPAEGQAAQAVPFSNVKKMNPPPVKWTGALVAGATLTRGNSDTDTSSLIFDAARRAEDDRWTLGAGYIFGRDGDDETKNNWWVQGQYDRFLTEKWYAYGNVRVEGDKIADLTYRVTPGVGLGYQWVESPDFNLSTEGGISYVCEKFEDDTHDNHWAARLAYHVDKKINDKVRVFHNAEYLPSVEDFPDDYNLNADAGIRSDLTDKLFAEFKVRVEYDASPADTADRTDTWLIFGVGWAF